MRHSFAKPEGDGKLARRTFIAQAMTLPLAIKIGVVFAAADLDPAAQSASRATIAKVWIAEFSDSGAATGVAALGKVVKSDLEWKQQLTAEQYNVTREG